MLFKINRYERNETVPYEEFYLVELNDLFDITEDFQNYCLHDGKVGFGKINLIFTLHGINNVFFQQSERMFLFNYPGLK